MSLITKNIVLLLLILSIGAFLRFYKLAEYPVGFHIDEASLGYNGYSILKTGKDEHGNRFPLYIDMFGDYRPSGYHFLTIVPISIFGLNEFAVRFPGAMFGSLTILCIYLLTFSIFSESRLSLISSLLLAISPWHIVLSRASAETIVALFFIILGFSFIFMSLKKQRVIVLAIGIFILSLSYFYYHTPRVFVPMLYICLLPIYLTKLNSAHIKLTKYFYSLVFSGIWFILLSYILIFIVKGGTGRFQQVSIFGNPETKLIVEEQLREDGSLRIPIIESRFFHNKLVNYSFSFLSNYFTYFNGNFLFMQGGLPQWYKVPNMGLFYITLIPFFVYGIFMLTREKNVLTRVIIIWILIAPFVAATTSDDVPNIQRSIIMFPVIDILIAYGLVKAISEVNYMRKLFYVILFGALCFNFSYFIHQYFVQSKIHQTRYRNNGFKEMIEKIKLVYHDYDYIIMTKTLGGIYPSVLFHMEYDPSSYQKEGSRKDNDFSGFGKFIFTPQFCPSLDSDDRFPSDGRIAFVNNGTCQIAVEHDTVYRQDGTEAFKIVYH